MSSQIYSVAEILICFRLFFQGEFVKKYIMILTEVRNAECVGVAWQADCDWLEARIDWQFATTDEHIKLKRLCLILVE